MACHLQFLAFWEPITSHIVAEIIFALILFFLQLLRFKIFLRKKFHNVKFKIYYKGSHRLCREAVCKVPINWKDLSILNPVIEYDGKQLDNPKEGEFHGDFIINPITFRTGQGGHFHQDYTGFNFPKIIIKDDDTFYVDTEYLTRSEQYDYIFEKKYQSYIWERVKK